MPRYRNEAGVVVGVSDEAAARIGGFTPLDEPEKKRVVPKMKHATKAKEPEDAGRDTDA